MGCVVVGDDEVGDTGFKLLVVPVELVFPEQHRQGNNYCKNGRGKNNKADYFARGGLLFAGNLRLVLGNLFNNKAFWNGLPCPGRRFFAAVVQNIEV